MIFQPLLVAPSGYPDYLYPALHSTQQRRSYLEEFYRYQYEREWRGGLNGPFDKHLTAMVEYFEVKFLRTPTKKIARLLARARCRKDDFSRSGVSATTCRGAFAAFEERCIEKDSVDSICQCYHDYAWRRKAGRTLNQWENSELRMFEHEHTAMSRLDQQLLVYYRTSTTVRISGHTWVAKPYNTPYFTQKCLSALKSNPSLQQLHLDLRCCFKEVGLFRTVLLDRQPNRALLRLTVECDDISVIPDSMFEVILGMGVKVLSMKNTYLIPSRVERIINCQYANGIEAVVLDRCPGVDRELLLGSSHGSLVRFFGMRNNPKVITMQDNRFEGGPGIEIEIGIQTPTRKVTIKHVEKNITIYEYAECIIDRCPTLSGIRVSDFIPLVFPTAAETLECVVNIIDKVANHPGITALSLHRSYDYLDLRLLAPRLENAILKNRRLVKIDLHPICSSYFRTTERLAETADALFRVWKTIIDAEPRDKKFNIYLGRMGDHRGTFGSQKQIVKMLKIPWAWGSTGLYNVTDDGIRNSVWDWWKTCTQKLAFAAVSHARLGKESSWGLLHADIIQAIANHL
jgi:hypothetical protein